MMSLSAVLLLLVPLGALYISHAVAAGIHLGETCIDTTNCTASDANSVCNTAKKCECTTTTHYKHNNTFCAKKTAFGSKCIAAIPCAEENTTCLNTCKCMDSHFRISAACEPRIFPNNKCDNKGNISCVDNAYCNHTTTGFCVCGATFMASKTSCNSAVTMAVVEISTLVICFMLAYLEVLK